MEDVLEDPARILQALHPCAQGMTFIPATATLAILLSELYHTPGSELRLKQALQCVEDHFDYAFIDCPSTLGSAMTNALIAADVALVPLQCDYLSLRGFADVQEIIAAIRDAVNPALRLRAVGTMFDRRTAHSNDVMKEARVALLGLVYHTVIPRTVRMAEAPATLQTILQYAPHSTGADAYRALAQEILQEESVYGTTRRDPSRHAEAAVHLQAV
jgi:chromosome partitioning protein